MAAARPAVTLRRAGPDDEGLQHRLGQPEVAGEYNTFDDSDGERPHTTVVSRWVIEADGVAVGVMSVRPVSYGPNPRSEAWNIGITVAPEFRGQGVGSAAQRLMADQLFATTEANRVEATTDVTNLAEQRALELAGYAREGVMRGSQWRGGRYHDMVVYARLRP